ncbi:hypothetical protein MY10362_009738 [Beauveria mimosiformis]
MQLFTSFLVASGFFACAFAVPVATPRDMATVMQGGAGFNGPINAREDGSGATVMQGGAGFN